MAVFARMLTATLALVCIVMAVGAEACNGILEIHLAENETFHLLSPNFPTAPYPSNANCTWQISAPVSYVIRAVPRTLDFEIAVGGYSSCSLDYVEISDPISNRRPDRWCKPYSYQNFVSTTNATLVHFESDESIERMGFNISLIALMASTTEKPARCEQWITLNSSNSELSDVLASPDYPNSYPADRLCQYFVKNDLTSTDVQLTFINFEVSAFATFFLRFKEPGANARTEVLAGSLKANFQVRLNAPEIAITFVDRNQPIGSNYSGFLIEVTAIRKPFTCERSLFKCSGLNQCINKEQLCDGLWQCLDRSDEHPGMCEGLKACGIQKTPLALGLPFTYLIIGGSEAKPGSWPWMVGLLAPSPETEIQQQHCGASLISSKWVLTAGHCVHQNTFQAVAASEPYKIRIGQHQKQDNDSWIFETFADRIFLHPRYVPEVIMTSGSRFDVALIRLAVEVPYPFNARIATPCLPDADHLPTDGDSCIIAGWGANDDGKQSDILRQVQVPIVPDKLCNDSDHYSGIIYDNVMLCVGFEAGGHASCQGDSGGPLVCKSKINGRWYQQGVVSWAQGCARPGRFAVFAKVSALLDFIHETILVNS